ncbi:MAG: heme ABC transporter ATP-binding protein [Mesorhizobium sp.]
MTHSIELEDVGVSIGPKQIVSGVSLAAQAGEVTAIVGPNGSGKSTLLKAISGEWGHVGRISIGGQDIRSMKHWQLAGRRAVLPQATSLSFPFTVLEVVRLGLTGGRSGVTGKALNLLPLEALERVDLGGFAGRFYQELSGGEQQRVQLARVLCQVWQPVLDGVPRYLLLDEPVSSLDIKHQLVIMNIAREFAQAGGGVIAVMHDLNLTAMFADRIVMMHRGRAEAVGSPSEVLVDERVSRVFECGLRVGVTPEKGAPFVLPQSVSL